MNEKEIMRDRAMEREVVVYMRLPSSVTDEEIDELSATLFEFVDMLGATIKEGFWEVSDDYRKQPKLSKAISSALETKYGDLITMDLLSLTSDRQKSLHVVQSMINNGGFVNFVDEESVLMECSLMINHDEDRNEWN